jgi:type VI secretion system protein
MSKSLHATLEGSRAAIERFVEKYEPRLSGVSVTRQDGGHDALRLLFAIEGVLEVEGRKQRTVFSVSLGASGEASVRHD